MRKLKIPIPPLQTQQKIISEVRNRQNKAEQLEKEAKMLLEETKERVKRIMLEN